VSRKIPDALLERYLAGDLSAERKSALDAELAQSPEDKARLDELRADSLAFLTRYPSGPLVAKYEASQPRAWWRPWLPVFAAAAAALLLVVVLKPPEPEMAVKGDLVFSAWTRAGERSQRVRRGQTLSAGDQVRFELKAPRPGYLAILSRDGDGHVSVYHPYGEPQAAPYLPDEAMLPGAIALDAVKGREQVWAVFSEQPFPLAPLLDALEHGGALTPSAQQTILELEWEKR